MVTLVDVSSRLFRLHVLVIGENTKDRMLGDSGVASYIHFSLAHSDLGQKNAHPSWSNIHRLSPNKGAC